MKRVRHNAVAISALAILPITSWLFVASPLRAQPTAPSGDQPAPGGTTSTTGAGSTGTTTTTTTTNTPLLNPYAPSQAQSTGPLGGGNATESSARTITGNEQDGFDLGRGGSTSGPMRGNKDGPIYMGRVTTDVPSQHVVRRGDTLSGICDTYFHNPYQWPRVWSFNPQIQNPHWIYPGDLIRLRVGGASGYGSRSATSSLGGGLVDRRRQLPIGTVILQDQGFIEDGSGEDWGEVTGSPADKMFLTQGDEIYLHVAGSRDVRIGQDLTIFRPVRSVPQGQVIQIQGTVRVNQWNAKERVARGELVESIDVVERGARIGPVGRRLQVVPPVRNETDVQAAVIASLHPNNFFGSNQVVFVDKGRLDGLKPGNRLFIMRRGDAWRRSLVNRNGPAEYRISAENENLPDAEKVPGSRDDQRYPDQMIGELRVVQVHDHTAVCLVFEAKMEIERSDIGVARRGY